MSDTHVLELQVAALTGVLRARDALGQRARCFAVDERGEVTSSTIIIGILAALALAVGAIITMKVTAAANSIPTE